VTSPGWHAAHNVAWYVTHEEIALSRLLVHLSTGPEHPTRAALAFLVARSAQQGGHDVDLFLAGDAVGLLRDATMDAVQGVGTGSLREHYEALSGGGARFFASGMSSKARALDADAVGGKTVEFVPPDRLVELVFEADRVISY
jgi:predicted peroxiredoxin